MIIILTWQLLDNLCFLTSCRVILALPGSLAYSFAGRGSTQANKDNESIIDEEAFRLKNDEKLDKKETILTYHFSISWLMCLSTKSGMGLG